MDTIGPIFIALQVQIMQQFAIGLLSKCSTLWLQQVAYIYKAQCKLLITADSSVCSSSLTSLEGQSKAEILFDLRYIINIYIFIFQDR